MALSNYYASIAVIEIHFDERVTIESISVTEGECVLSGAWEFPTSNTSDISSVLSGKLIIALTDSNAISALCNGFELTFIDSEPFIKDAKNAVEHAMVAYEAFKAENPTKRKKLVAPEFSTWPDSIDFTQATTHLESIGKMATPVGTPELFKRTLAAARLVKMLVDMWHFDEQERKNRKYVEGEDARITILPESWLFSSEYVKGD